MIKTKTSLSEKSILHLRSYKSDSEAPDKKSENSSLSNLLIKNDMNIKIATIFSIFCCVTCMITSILASIFYDKIILNFDFSYEVDKVSQSTLILFYVLLGMIISINLFH
jgi:ABC-type bacteriocin/lantibiotic exporter with double-glycine peptidase domain